MHCSPPPWAGHIQVKLVQSVSLWKVNQSKKQSSGQSEFYLISEFFTSRLHQLKGSGGGTVAACLEPELLHNLLTFSKESKTARMDQLHLSVCQTVIGRFERGRGFCRPAPFTSCGLASCTNIFLFVLMFSPFFFFGLNVVSSLSHRNRKFLSAHFLFLVHQQNTHLNPVVGLWSLHVTSVPTDFSQILNSFSHLMQKLKRFPKYRGASKQMWSFPGPETFKQFQVLV